MGSEKQTVSKNGGRHLKLNIGLIVFIGIFIYLIAIGLSYLMRNHISFYEVQQGWIVDSDTFTGFILRNEAVVNTGQSGYINYFVNDGAMVAREGNVCMVTTNAGSGVQGIADGSALTLNDSDYSDIREQVLSFKKKYNDSDYASVYDLDYQLGNIVSNIVSRNNINSMNQADSASGYTVMTADQSGIVSYSYDGMESYTQDDMTPELFSARNYEKTQLSAGMKIDSASPAYKLIYDDNWQIVICPTADQYKRLKELDTVNLQLQRDNITVSADVSTFQKDGTDYVSFSLSNYMVRYCNDRYIDIEIIWDNHDGLKIPKSSIVSKNFYRIPADYLQTEEESSESGFYSVDNDETVFIKPVIYAQNKEYCYVDCADIAEGTVLKKPSSDETYTIGETEALKGVYNINKGYAMFRLIDILYEYGDYCIVSDKTDYGVTLYDHIILNGSSVKENDIIY